jgi:hypothetical protein
MKRDAGDLVGRQYGRLTVLCLWRDRGTRGNKLWFCKCSCGNSAVKTTSQIRDKSNPNVSCGCGNAESIRKASSAAWEVTTKFRHPLKIKMKNMWRNMLHRCYDPDNKRYQDYGGRGIRVCNQWLNDRYSFYRWCVANGIQPNLQIDRKDNDGPYSPENCKFSTRLEQANNTRKNRRLQWRGESLTLAQWARKLGVRQQALSHRVERGWTVERIFQQPYRRSR